VATLDLRAGEKPRRPLPMRRRVVFLAMALLDERDWSSQYELTFSLWLNRGGELLSVNSNAAATDYELFKHGTRKSRAALIISKSNCICEGTRATVDHAAQVLRLLASNIPAHRRGSRSSRIRTVWRTLDGASRPDRFR